MLYIKGFGQSSRGCCNMGCKFTRFNLGIIVTIVIRTSTFNFIVHIFPLRFRGIWTEC